MIQKEKKHLNIFEDDRGLLVSIESFKDIPFEIKRIYFIKGVPLNTARGYISGAGAQTFALAYAGLAGSSYKTVTESWNGTSWTEQNDMSSARFNTGDGGSAIGAIAYGGSAPSGETNVTEEFTANNTLADVSFD